MINTTQLKIMIFTTINICSDGEYWDYSTYHSFRTSRLVRALSLDVNRHSQLCRHLNHIHLSEMALEIKYGLPRGLLKGSHLIFGTIRDLREGLADDYLRSQIKEELIMFRVEIETETRKVRVFTSATEDGTYTLFKEYILRHDFYGMATTDGEIARAS